jgi:adenine-specific DNA-methyltransferase
MEPSKQSTALNKVLTKDEKSEFGIFFTPPQIIHDFYKHINDHLIKDSDRLYILEPSCGSCEFIDAFAIHIDRKKSIDAIEFHPRIFTEISAIKRNDVSYIHGDFLEYDMKHTKKYDLIIGNPPYYVCDKAKVPDHFMKRENAYFEGRIQIFILFLLHALPKLKEDGILAFILPKSILNSAYYRKSRSYIY